MTSTAAGVRAWAQVVRELASAQDAVIPAHNYQIPQIRDVADHVGDSLALSRITADCDASTIVFAGVHFMAETAKLLSPDKRVLIPDATAGCPLADSITADQLRDWKREHPGALVVSHVNTTAEVKAKPDIRCTPPGAPGCCPPAACSRPPGRHGLARCSWPPRRGCSISCGGRIPPRVSPR